MPGHPALEANRLATSMFLSLFRSQVLLRASAPAEARYWLCLAPLVVTCGCSRKALSPTSPPSPAPSATAIPSASPAVPSATAGALAAKAFRAALKANPSDRKAFFGLAAMYETKGYLDRLIELCEQRLAAQPNDTETMLRLSGLYSRVEDKAAAAAIMARAERTAPEDSSVQAAAALAHYQFGEHVEAIASLKKFLAKHPDAHGIWYRLSEIQRVPRQFTESEKSIREAIRLAPKEPGYYRQLGHILAMGSDKSRMAEAEQAVRKARQMGDESLDAAYWLAYTLDMQGKGPDAIAAYEAVEKDDVAYEKTAFRLGMLYQQSGKQAAGAKLLKLYKVMERNRVVLGEAITHLRKHPDQPSAYRKVARLYDEAGESGVGAAILRRALKRWPDDRRVGGDLQLMLWNSGRKTEAKAMEKSAKPRPSGG